MIRFQQTFGAHAGRTYEFDKDVVRFGRQPDSDVAFDAQADLDASGRHAEVRRERGQYYVVDNGSRNGTWLNGHRVERAVLSTGDEIEFGHGGPRMKVELVHFSGSAMVTGPMSGAAGVAAAAAVPGPPGRVGQPTAAATPVPSDIAGPVDARGVTMAATPVPGPGGVQTPIPMSAPTPGFGGASATPTPYVAGAAAAGAAAGAAGGAGGAGVAGGAGAAAHAGGGAGPAGAQGQYGQKTVAMMISSAVQQARHDSAGGANRSTAFIRAVASEAASHSSRGLKIALGVVATLFLFAVVGLVVLFVVYRQEAEEGRRQTEQLRNQLDQRGPAGSRIAAAYEGAIYLLVESQGSRERGMCSAFAVEPDLLATNAHCVLAMEEGMGRGATYQAMPNGGRGDRIPILEMWRHPSYTRDADHPSADVGLLRAGATTPVQVVLANMQQLSEVRAGTQVYVFGFPGDLANPVSPVATITDGVVGRMTAFDGTGADFAQSQLIQHSAFTSPGTSGSPIFDAEGLVVAVNAGTFRSSQRQQVVGPLGSRQQTVLAESGYKYGIRVDLLASLIAGLHQR